MNFRSKSVVIANGAQQSIDPNLSIFFSHQTHKIVTSDAFLRKETFINRVSKLNAGSKIVIIGGSHSGFSCAWLLLNGSAAHSHD